MDKNHHDSYLHGECKKIASDIQLIFYPQISDCHCSGCTGILCSDLINVTGRVKCCGDTCRRRYGPTILQECEFYNLAMISGSQTYMDSQGRNFTIVLNCVVGSESCVTTDLAECWTKDDEFRFVGPRDSLIRFMILCVLYTLLVILLVVSCVFLYKYILGTEIFHDIK